MSDILLTDRTTIETDWKCGMKRWWYKEHGGTGIVPVVEAVYFKEGRDWHSAVALIAEGAHLQSVLDQFPLPDTQDQATLEPAQRLRGWIAGFGMYIWPRLQAQYEVVFIEHEIVLERDPLWIATTPDLVLRDRTTGRLVIFDYKTVGILGRGWFDYWPKAVQMQILLKAVEEELGEKPSHAQVIGLTKGQVRYGRLSHPYVWAYRTEGGDWRESYNKSLTAAHVWEYSGGILAWVERLGPDTATAVFPFSAPVFLDERLLETLIQARTNREQEVRIARDLCQVDPVVRARFFEPRFSECRPVIGSPCPYLAACHNATVAEDPIRSGLYIPRTPHHDLELISSEDSDE